MGGGAPGETRTHDLLVRNQMLYPLSYGRLRCRSLPVSWLIHRNAGTGAGEIATSDNWSLAEREGFEPSKQVAPLSGLANRRTRPLCDLSQTEGR